MDSLEVYPLFNMRALVTRESARSLENSLRPLLGGAESELVLDFRGVRCRHAIIRGRTPSSNTAADDSGVHTGRASNYIPESADSSICKIRIHRASARSGGYRKR